jgi:hypothetical protein
MLAKGLCWNPATASRRKGGGHMKSTDCLFERASNIGVAVALLLMAGGLSVVGVTILPVLGIFLAIPVLVGAVAFLIAPRSKECQL